MQVQSLWDTMRQFLVRLSIRLAQDPRTMLLHIYMDKVRFYVCTKTLTVIKRVLQQWMEK
jgi:hypothetical protein